MCVAACVDAADHTERSETAQAGADPVAQHAATYEAAWSRARSNEGDELGVAAASEAATAAADAASLIPKPTAIGSSQCLRMVSRRCATSALSRCPAPVTPLSDT